MITVWCPKTTKYFTHYSSEFGGIIPKSDYTMVRDLATDTKDLEDIYDELYDDSSIIIGSGLVIVIDDKAYYCEPWGWSEITFE